MNVEIRPILPPSFYQLQEGLRTRVRQAINTQMHAHAQMARTLLEDATSNWSPPPSFIVAGSVEAGEMAVLTDDDRYLWVDSGTRPHTILPRRKKMLVFQRSYSAKTKGGGGSSSGPIVRAFVVHHPGIRAARISEKVAKEVDLSLRATIQAAIQNALTGGRGAVVGGVRRGRVGSILGGR